MLESLLSTFGLEGTVKSTTRVTSYSKTQIDNIFLNNKSFKASTYVIVNGISDHEGELLILPNLTTTSHDNVNSIFNSFSDTYLRIFQTSFLTKRICSSLNVKPWLMQGIKTSCCNKKTYIRSQNTVGILV